MAAWFRNINESTCCMKALFSMVRVLVLLVVAPLYGAGSESGFVQIANAVGRGDGPLMVSVDGRQLRADGFQTGDVTGALVLASGRHVVRVKQNGLVTGMTRIEVVPGKLLTLIPFAEKTPAKQGGGEVWRLRILKLALADAGDQRLMQLVSVAAVQRLPVEWRRLDGAWQTVNLKRAQPMSVLINQHRGYVALRCGGARLGSVPVGPPGNHLVVVHDDGAGAYACIVFAEARVWLPP